MSPLTTATLGLLAGIGVGYPLGRYQPMRRISDWANWQKYDQAIRKHSVRWWAIYVVLSAENLASIVAWLVRNPRRGWHAWRVSNGRNDPPITATPKYDPDWAAKRRAHTSTEESR
ncbi:hypothetical protein ACFVOR_37280 [Streptomyces sp. NPDC057837]|uniref:hypothetical protein n=1 Tax=Streptomyces sp. NPDC057837 TaxID=3346260 RepID=UPI0036BC6DCE